jgi:hypothetical protein
VIIINPKSLISPIPIPKNTRHIKIAAETRRSRIGPSPKIQRCSNAAYNKIFVYIFGMTYELTSAIHMGIATSKSTKFTSPNYTLKHHRIEAVD